MKASSKTRTKGENLDMQHINLEFDSINFQAKQQILPVQVTRLAVNAWLCMQLESGQSVEVNVSSTILCTYYKNSFHFAEYWLEQRLRWKKLISFYFYLRKMHQSLNLFSLSNWTLWRRLRVLLFASWLVEGAFNFSRLKRVIQLITCISPLKSLFEIVQYADIA